MIDRCLPDALVNRLVGLPFWHNVVQDRSLSPEIRNGHLTVYYRGGALIRELRLDGDALIANVHPKYIPVKAAGNNVRLTFAEHGFGLSDEASPVPLGVANPEVLAAYKQEMAQVLNDFPEGELVQQIIERAENCILDQEIVFQGTGDPRDKIDLCHYDGKRRKLAFVEVKRRDDVRLFRPDARPHVLDQLAAYGKRLVEHGERLLKTYREVAHLKRQIGLGDRISALPESGPEGVFEKPVLVIGNCSRADVVAIRDGRDEWAPLMDGLPGVAAGLILCGTNGCGLDLVPGRQTVLFSDSVGD